MATKKIVKKTTPKKKSVKKAVKSSPKKVVKRSPKKNTKKKTVKRTNAKKSTTNLPIRDQKSYSVDEMKRALHEMIKPSDHCNQCSHFPVGASELVSLLLVLIFALSAVLMTSVYALNQQSIQIDILQEQVSS